MYVPKIMWLQERKAVEVKEVDLGILAMVKYKPPTEDWLETFQSS